MDPISYGVAAKQKQRIEKIIAEPDSTSGVITVPQVIATGETITVPAGRTAILPNVRVDGELVVDGEVFIPSGSGYSGTEVDVTVVKQNGNVVANDIDVVHKTGNETIAGVKTFSSSPIVPNATTATQPIAYGQAVKLTGNETISGTKTFSSSPVVPNATTVGQVVNKGQLDTKQDTLVSGTNIKTINSTSLLGSGDISVVSLTGNETISGTKTFSNTIIGNISGTATTATNLSGGSVSGTTGSFSGVLSINSTTPTLINAGSNSSYGSGIKFLNNSYAHHSIGVKGSSFVISNTSSGPTGWDSPLDRLTIDSSGNATFSGTVSGTSFNSITALSSTTPVMNGTAAIGTSTTVARADHVHASDTSKASLSGATFTGAVSGTTFSATTFTGALSGNATTATTATNLSGGSVGTMPYQTASGATAQLAAGTSGYFLKSNGTAAPSWANPAEFIPLTSLSDVTIASPTSNQALVYNGTSWVNSKVGKVLQVVQVVKSDIYGTSSTSWVDVTGMSATITPTSSTSKILIMMSGAAGMSGAVSGWFRLLKNGILSSYVGDAVSGYDQVTSCSFYGGSGDGNNNESFVINYLDSPSTTSAVTYSLQTRVQGGVMYLNTLGSNIINQSYSVRSPSSIILMEIGA